MAIGMPPSRRAFDGLTAGAALRPSDAYGHNSRCLRSLTVILGSLSVSLSIAMPRARQTKPIMPSYRRCISSKSRGPRREPAVRRDRAEITHPSGRHHAVTAALKTRRPAPLGIRNARDHRKRPRGAPASALSVQPFVQPPQAVRPPNPGSELRANRATERRQKRLAMNPICSDTSGTRSFHL